MLGAASSFKVILFDFGSTLIYSKDPWPPIYEQADRALEQVFKRAGVSLEIKAFSSEFETFLDSYYAERGTSPIEKTTFSSLQELLQQKGFQEIPVSVVRAALEAMYSITQQNWYLEADTIPTLKTLRENGYRLGMVSNTSDDKNVQQLVDRWKLRPFFETIVTSAGCGFRKPDQRIFRLALDHFGVPPEQVAMVGDSPEADILGANQMGFYSILITRRACPPEEGELTIQPQAVIPTLDLLPGLLADVENEAP
ncbi:MAG: HAD family hydrolase [Anaerolineales bacterium]|jgi:HAD superfamily hydrolase (TIGR01662 family)